MGGLPAIGRAEEEEEEREEEEEEVVTNKRLGGCHPGLLERLQELVDVALAAEEQIGFDDGHQAGGLAGAGSAREAIGGLRRCDRGEVAHAHCGAPLREAWARLVMTDGGFLVVVEATAPILAVLPA